LKKIILAFLITAAVSAQAFLFSVGQAAPSGKVIVYYFHGSFRCPTCHKLEQYSKEAIEANFKDALASGKLEFKVVNVEDKDNEHFVNDYQLYTKSLVISLIENGKEVKSKNLAKIWDYAGNKQKFFDYVTSEINEFLKGT
jgi:hypothetical protein